MKFKRTEQQDLTFSAATAWPWSFESGKKSERRKGGLDWPYTGLTVNEILLRYQFIKNISARIIQVDFHWMVVG